MFSFQCGTGRDDLNFGKWFVLVFRFVWKFQKTKPEIKGDVARENFRPEVLFSLESFLKKIRNAYVGLYIREIIYNYLVVL